MATVKIVKNKEEVITNLVNTIKNCSDESIQQNGLFKIGVSGGSLIDLLATGLPKIQTDFTKWKIFFCDERIVPENSTDSTFGAYKTKLIDKTNLLEENQFVRIKQGVAPQATAADYQQQMMQYFSGNLPQFDMLLLGMGPDGHTCSLFPGHKLLEITDNDKWIVDITDSPKPPPCRVTLTLPVINNAKNCIFAICGKEKAEMVKKILVDHEDLPCTRVKPQDGNLLWIVDEDAGHYLRK